MVDHPPVEDRFAIVCPRVGVRPDAGSAVSTVVEVSAVDLIASGGDSLDTVDGSVEFLARLGFGEARQTDTGGLESRLVRPRYSLSADRPRRTILAGMFANEHPSDE